MLLLMRTAMLAAAMAVAITVWGCATEKPRPERDDFMSASTLGVPSDSLLRHLTPEERAALDRVGMTDKIKAEEAMGDPEPDADLEAPDAEHESGADRAGKMGVAVLQVGITLGMLAAPFFLF